MTQVWARRRRFRRLRVASDGRLAGLLAAIELADITMLAVAGAQAFRFISRGDVAPAKSCDEMTIAINTRRCGYRRA